MEHGLWTLAELSLAGSLLALVVLAATRLLRGRISHTAAYYLWLLVLLRLVLPLGLPGTGLDLPQPHQSAAVETDYRQVLQAQQESVSAPETSAAERVTPPAAAEPPAEIISQEAPEPAVSWAQVLFWVWLAGAGVSLGWPVLSYLRFCRVLRRTNLPPLPEDQQVLGRLCPRHPPALWCSPAVSTPMLAGLFRPAILLPRQAYVTQGAGEELEHILRHELTHYRRLDILYKWAVTVVTALHWFNPLMYLLRRRIARACELACDEGAVKGMTPQERTRYSQTLLALAVEGVPAAPALTTALNDSKRALRERLLGVLRHKAPTRAMGAAALALALILTTCGAALGPGEGSLTPGVSARQDPWLARSEEEITAAGDWLTQREARLLAQSYDQAGEEFTLNLSLPLEDGTTPAQPWTVGLGCYEAGWTQGSPYVLWDIKRQPVRNTALGTSWMTVEEWFYRGLLRVTLLTDLRTRAVWTGEAESPSALYSLSTIQPGCTTHRGVGVGDTLADLQAAYPELQLLYRRQPGEEETDLRSRGIADHDACWRFAPEDREEAHVSGRTILFLTKGDRIVQLDVMTECDGTPWGLGYYLSDWAYQGGAMG